MGMLPLPNRKKPFTELWLPKSTPTSATRRPPRGLESTEKDPEAVPLRNRRRIRRDGPDGPDVTVQTCEQIIHAVQAYGDCLMFTNCAKKPQNLGNMLYIFVPSSLSKSKSSQMIIPRFDLDVQLGSSGCPNVLLLPRCVRKID